MKAVDVMGFAGSFGCGVDQAGFDVIAKREPTKFGGFGMASMLYNMPWIEGQLAAPEDWDLPPEDVELVYGCPPCSGFSQLSHANTQIHGAVVGPEAEINECMHWLIEYAARVRPQVVILESVGVAFKSGRLFMESLWEKLREQSGVDYYLTHVNMNAALVGGDVIRPRYFLVAHRDPFGVGLEFVSPRPAAEVVGDLPAATDPDPDWGHLLHGSTGVERFVETMKVLRAKDRVWRPGTRLPDNIEGLETDPDLLALWLRPDGKISGRARDWFEQRDLEPQPVYSHFFSTDPFSTYRWRPDHPFGVIVAASLDRAINPIHDRPITFREAARFMSLPDDWSMRSIVERQAGGELGKAVPTASGKWIAHWARMSVEGTPGEFAGVAADYDDRIRIVNVQNEKQVRALLDSPPRNSFWDGDVADPAVATWIVDRKARPVIWPQRATSTETTAVSRSVQRRVATQKTRREASRRAETPAARASGTIERVAPEVVAGFISGLGIDKKEAARRLGVSYSRINELTTHTRPKSWLNAARWPEVQEALSAEA